ncbi:MAG: DUF2306 domain-containing protein [Coriobacteriales bacterium]|nr:DUF2306 domain-containing protein [Coriobacteriales bacterium]
MRVGATFWLFALACVGIALAAPFPYLTQPLDRLAEGGKGIAVHYAGQSLFMRQALLVHASSAGVALLLTPLQWSARFRRRWLAGHRVVGRITAVAIAVGAASGLIIAQVSYAGLVGTVGFSALALAWAASCTQMVRHARAKQLEQHRRWAIRTTALTFAGVTLRALVGIGIAFQQPATAVASQAAFDRVYVVMPFLCWVPNLLVAEWILRRAPRASRTATTHR